jgi:two-component sensor histidine kinase
MRRRQAEEQTKASLAEKEVLLKEIHHRVKNNLQVISSLLNLQSSYITDEQSSQMFRESQNRVRSMALIHEKLYQSSDLARIDFAGYVRELSDYLFRMYGAKSHNIKLEVNVDDVPLDIDTAIPCGLIINELISNSLKYGFPAETEKRKPEGEIRVGLCAGNDDKLILTVSDNGTGFPENLDFQNTDSLGLQLVNTLTGQLEGDIQLDRKAGTTFNITFAGPKSKGAVK